MNKELLVLSLDEVEREANNTQEVKLKYKSSEELDFIILKKYGALSEKSGAAYFSYVDWNGHKKYDLRKWNEDMTRPYKGITFSESEIDKILDIPLKIECSSNYRKEYIGGKAKAKIYDNIAILSFETVKDVIWNKEINIVDWGYGKRIDIRKWTEDYTKCGKGICISIDEFKNLYKMISNDRS